MTRNCWWLVSRVSRVLEPDERNAVLGDFAESGVTATRALRDLLGLIIRLQAAFWKDWRPWLALVGLVGIVGLRLSRISLGLSFALDLNLRTYWKHGVRYENGLTVFEEIVVFLSQGLALLAWSWASGFVLGSLSRRTIWVTGTLYFLVLVYPLPFMLYFIWAHPYRDPSEVPVLLLMLTLQILVRTLLFLLPSLAGVRQGLRKITLTLPQTGMLAIATVAVIAMATWTGGWRGAAMLRWSGGEWDASAGWQGRLFSFAVMSWPVVYMIAIASWQRWHDKAAGSRA